MFRSGKDSGFNDTKRKARENLSVLSAVAVVFGAEACLSFLMRCGSAS